MQELARLAVGGQPVEAVLGGGQVGAVSPRHRAQGVELGRQALDPLAGRHLDPLAGGHHRRVRAEAEVLDVALGRERRLEGLAAVLRQIDGVGGDREHQGGVLGIPHQPLDPGVLQILVGVRQPGLAGVVRHHHAAVGAGQHVLRVARVDGHRQADEIVLLGHDPGAAQHPLPHGVAVIADQDAGLRRHGQGAAGAGERDVVHVGERVGQRHPQLPAGGGGATHQQVDEQQQGAVGLSRLDGAVLGVGSLEAGGLLLGVELELRAAAQRHEVHGAGRQRQGVEGAHAAVVAERDPAVGRADRDPRGVGEVDRHRGVGTGAKVGRDVGDGRPSPLGPGWTGGDRQRGQEHRGADPKGAHLGDPPPARHARWVCCVDTTARLGLHGSPEGDARGQFRRRGMARQWIGSAMVVQPPVAQVGVESAGGAAGP